MADNSDKIYPWSSANKCRAYQVIMLSFIGLIAFSAAGSFTQCHQPKKKYSNKLKNLLIANKSPIAQLINKCTLIDDPQEFFYFGSRPDLMSKQFILNNLKSFYSLK